MASVNSVILDKVFVLQKKAIRAVFNLKRNQTTKLVFSSNDLLTVYNINLCQTACYMYKALNNLISRSVESFTLNNELHCYNTRQKDLIHVPLRRTCVREQSICVRGVSVWNNIPEEIRLARTFYSFKSHYKASLLLS